MSAFDDMLDRATRRLRIDRELQLEVRRELETHLQEAAKEFESGGDSEQQARANAVRAIGDADSLADQLWQANRRRIRLRYWVKWVGRITVLPTIVVVAGVLVLSGVLGIGQLGQFQSLLSNNGTFEPATFPWTGALYGAWVTAQMDPTQRLVVFGKAGAKNKVAAQKAIWERYPNRPMFYANYLWTLYNSGPYLDPMNPADQRKIDARRQRLLKAAKRGEKIEPDNGLYDLLRAGLLFETSLKEHKKATPYTVATTKGRKTVSLTGYRVLNAKRYERALALAARAVAHPYIRSYSILMERYRQTLLPATWSYAGFLYRTWRSIGVLLPALAIERNVARAVSNEALRQAEAGHPQRAKRMLLQVRRLGGLAAKDAHCLIQVLVAQSIVALADRHAEVVWTRLGKPEMAQAAVDRMAAANRASKQVARWVPSSKPRRSMISERDGAILTMLMPETALTNVNATPIRQAEWTSFDEGMLGLGATAGLLILCGWALWMGLLWWRRRGGDDAPMLMWIGWRRLAIVLGGGVALPLAAWAIWVWAWPNGSHRYGLNYTWRAALVEWAVLWAAMVMATTHLGLRATRQRAGELGIAQPTPMGRRSRWALGLIVVPLGPMVIGALVWLRLSGKQMSGRWLVALLAMTAVAVVAWVSLYTLRRLVLVRRTNRAYTGAASRTLGAILGLGVLAAVLLAGLPLKGVEVWRGRQITGPGDVFIMNELHLVKAAGAMQRRLVKQMPPPAFPKGRRQKQG